MFIKFRVRVLLDDIGEAKCGISIFPGKSSCSYGVLLGDETICKTHKHREQIVANKIKRIKTPRFIQVHLMMTTSYDDEEL